MVVQGIGYLRRILEYRDAVSAGNRFLATVASLPMSKRDVPYAIDLARRGLRDTGPDDPSRYFLERIVAFHRKDGKYDRNDPGRILRICDEGVEVCEFSAPGLYA